MKSLVLLVTLTMATGCSPMSYQRGVPNIAQVDTNVWRSGQITTAEGWNYIAELAAGRHVHVIKLNFDSEGSDALAVERGFDVVVLAIEPRGDQDLWDDLTSAFAMPNPATVARIDAVLNVATHSPGDFYLVHCTHGQDRTGFVVGRHRVKNDGWTKARAYTEMLDHHFHPELHGVHEAWERFRPDPDGNN